MPSLTPLVVLTALLAFVPAGQPWHGMPVELTTNMKIDVDGAPNAYGPRGKPTLDFEANAHEGARLSGKIVGYLTANGKPVVQGPTDPFPGYYISTTGFVDQQNHNLNDPRRYVDASKINYVVLGSLARKNHVALGDLAAVHSSKTGKTVYAVVGDSGNSSGAEGSLALLQALGYPFTTGKAGEVQNKEITIRYFPASNPAPTFFHTQDQIDQLAFDLGLNKQFH